MQIAGSPKRIRTAETTLKGWCLNRLTMGPNIMVAVGGLEPPTFRVWAERYNQLSYTATRWFIII